ncbi:hypothetical protein L0B52_00805 [Suttonella sp. R2A3]|uniref:hypothetical protein n=1 Tax=Suttonella sp. R2A3 TaxID=2908648 RepID=UPI001F2F935C|nr:hypothetical protein [Suttonella sp. R2A3]UJF24709.1 hypothetical protein L0B52_00805 [Suttonella sp. R2A3]
MVRTVLCWALLITTRLALADDVTAGLWLCSDPSGVDNVVNTANRPTDQNCRPYSANALKKPSHATTTSAQKPTSPSVPPSPPVPSATKIQLHYADMTQALAFDHPAQTTHPSTTPLYKADVQKIYACEVNGQQRIVERKQLPNEDCVVMGAKGGSVAALMAEPSQKPPQKLNNRQLSQSAIRASISAKTVVRKA